MENNKDNTGANRRPDSWPPGSLSSQSSGGRSRSRLASWVAVIGILAMLGLAEMVLRRLDPHDPPWLRALTLMFACAGPWFAVAPIPAQRAIAALAARLPFGGGK